MPRAIDRLAAAVRFFTLADGRLAAFQGGEERRPRLRRRRPRRRTSGERPRRCRPRRSGYHRLDGRDPAGDRRRAAPGRRAPGASTACAQPLAIEVLAGGRRLIIGSGWSPAAHGPAGAAAGGRRLDRSRVGDARLRRSRCSGLRRQRAGPAPARRLRRRVEARRHEAPGAALAGAGARRLAAALRPPARAPALPRPRGRRAARRGPAGPARRDGAGRRPPLRRPSSSASTCTPQVSALIARDRKQRAAARPRARRPAGGCATTPPRSALEPSTHYQGGQARHGAADRAARPGAARRRRASVRWKLSAAHSRSEPPRVDAAEVRGLSPRPSRVTGD